MKFLDPLNRYQLFKNTVHHGHLYRDFDTIYNNPGEIASSRMPSSIVSVRSGVFLTVVHWFTTEMVSEWRSRAGSPLCIYVAIILETKESCCRTKGDENQLLFATNTAHEQYSDSQHSTVHNEILIYCAAAGIYKALGHIFTTLSCFTLSR
jgi:hypothetical protein